MPWRFSSKMTQFMSFLVWSEDENGSSEDSIVEKLSSFTVLRSDKALKDLLVRQLNSWCLGLVYHVLVEFIVLWLCKDWLLKLKIQIFVFQCKTHLDTSNFRLNQLQNLPPQNLAQLQTQPEDMQTPRQTKEAEPNRGKAFDGKICKIILLNLFSLLFPSDKSTSPICCAVKAREGEEGRKKNSHWLKW